MDRLAGQRGACGADATLRVARAALHEWEEPGIAVGPGSGAVFFSFCPLRCLYCQNAEIAQGAHGTDISVERLARIFCELRGQGAANVNLVTPTHYWPHIAAARESLPAGFDLPFVCNTSGYERAEVIRAFADCVDVYLTDFKYASSPDSDAAGRYSHAEDYFEVACAALDAMLECAGEPCWGDWRPPAPGASDVQRLECAPERRLERGVVVRHLLLPGRLEDSKRVMAHLRARYGNAVLYSVMDQYTPMHAFSQAPELGQRTEREDYERLLDFLDGLGMQDYFWQEGGAAEGSFIPPFDNTGVE